MADDFSPEPPERDLLGDPYKALPDPRGRRKLRYKPETYEKVEAFAADGMTHDDIASALAIDPKTLRKYFSRELTAGPARRRAQLLAQLSAKADGGNMAAIKLQLERIEKADRKSARPFSGAAIPSPQPKPAAAAEPKPEKLGKKEATDLRAAQPPESWAELLVH